MEGSDVRCERCGASVPLVSTTHARCVYCFHDQALPPDVARAVTANASLDAHLEAAAKSGERAFASMYRSGLGLQIFLVVSILLGAIPGLYLFFASASDSSAEGRVRFAIYGLSALATLAMAALPLMWLRTLKRSKEKRFASLPLAHVRVEGDALIASCSRCGAQATTFDDVAITCAHCGTQSLLPQPLVASSLRRRHQRIVQLRIEGETAARDATTDAVQSWQKNVVPMIIRVNIVIGVLIFAAVIAYKLANPE